MSDFYWKFNNPIKVNNNYPIDITLRDYFAAKAMQAILSKQAMNDEMLVCRAYEIADEMLKERIADEMLKKRVE